MGYTVNSLESSRLDLNFKPEILKTDSNKSNNDWFVIVLILIVVTITIVHFYKNKE
jgi:hypothetical protein